MKWSRKKEVGFWVALFVIAYAIALLVLADPADLGLRCVR